MNTSVDNIQASYFKGLEEYLSTENEGCLSRAFELGRDSIKSDLSELDIIELHHQSLSKLNSKYESNEFGRPNDVDKRLQLAAVYLKEWLAPYEVKLRSFQNVIQELNTKNEQLTEEIKNRRQIQEELLASKDYFQALIEHGQDIITVLDHNGIIRYNSPSVERILNYSQTELVGRDTFQYVHEDDVDRVKQIFNRIVETPDNVESAEFRFLHKDGYWVYLESIAKHVEDSRDGSIVIVNSRDVTERKFALRQLRESRAKLAEAQRIAKVGSWEWKPGKESELVWSDEMCRIYGLSPEVFDHSYDTFVNHVHPDDRKHIEQTVEYALKNQTSFSFEHKIIRSDGKVRTLLCNGQAVADGDGEVVKVIGTGQDITEQKEKEEQLRAYSKQLQELSVKIERTREEERIRIAREIHDELGQMLTVLKMDVSMLSGQMKKKIPGDILEYFNSEAEKILHRINTIIESVQRITTSLRPEVLDDLGLKEAIEWQAKQFANQTGINVQFNTNLEDADFLMEVQSTTLFRILQETLTNIMRHADATKVKITLEARNSNIHLRVKDNGVGITAKQKQAPTSFGLIGMRERTQFLGGDVQIKGVSGEGTSITVWIPLEEQQLNEKRVL